MAKNSNRNEFLQSRIGNAILGIICFAAAFLLFLRATDTGSLQQYGLLFLFIGLGINRLISTVKGRKQV